MPDDPGVIAGGGGTGQARRRSPATLAIAASTGPPQGLLPWATADCRAMFTPPAKVARTGTHAQANKPLRKVAGQYESAIAHWVAN